MWWPGRDPHVMASSTRTAQQWEASAREYWKLSGPARKVTGRPGTGNLVTASNALPEAVAALLSEAGVEAEVLQARHVAEMPAVTRFMTIRVSHNDTTVLTPIIPGDPAVRLYPGDTEGDLGQPEQVRPVTPDPDHWVSAADIAKQLRALVTGEEDL